MGEDRMLKDIGGIVDNLNEMNKIVDYDKQFSILVDFYNLFPETPSLWYGILLKMAQRVTECLVANGFEKDDVVYDQCKEKFGQLRIYFTIPKFFQDEVSDEMYSKLDKLSTEIGMIVMDAETEVRYL